MALSFSKISNIVKAFRVLPSPTIPALPSISLPVKSSLTCLVTRNYAAPAATSAAPSKAKAATAGGKIKEYPVETDPHKLVNYCCGLNYIEGSEEVKLKPDNEYPDWLYKIYIGKAKPLSELDPNTKEYWQKVRYLAIRRKVELRRFREKSLETVPLN